MSKCCEMRQRVKAIFEVLNEKGLHTRPSAELVKCVAQYSSQVELSYRDYIVNGKSILGILMLAAEKGAQVEVEAVGDDAEDAVAAILSLAQAKFNIEY